MKLGVICDGISRDLRHAVDVMDEFDLEYAELQYVGDTEVGDHTPQEIVAIDELLRDRQAGVVPVSAHICGHERRKSPRGCSACVTYGCAQAGD